VRRDNIYRAYTRVEHNNRAVGDASKHTNNLNAKWCINIGQLGTQINLTKGKSIALINIKPELTKRALTDSSAEADRDNSLRSPRIRGLRSVAAEGCGKLQSLRISFREAGFVFFFASRKDDKLGGREITRRRGKRAGPANRDITTLKC